MDVELADWTTGAARVVGYQQENPNQYKPKDDWERIRTHQRMFRDLPLMPGANELVDVARRFRDNLDYELIFLTAIPHYNDIHWAFWDKFTWAQKYFPDIPVHFGPYSGDKQRHCQPGDILVDDRPDNCGQWQAAGGRSILVQPRAVMQAKEELEAIYRAL